MSANYTFGADTSAFNAAVQGMGRQVTTASGQITKSFANIGAAMGSYLTVGAIVGFTKSVIDLGSKISDAAYAANMSIERYQTLAAVGKDTGIAFDQIQKSIIASNKAVIEASNGSAKYEKLLSDLGLSAGQLKAMEMDKQFEAIAIAASKVANPQERMNALSEIFGARVGPRMLEMMDKISGSGGLGKLQEEFEKTGRILDTDTTQKLDKLSDQLGILSDKLNVQGGKEVASWVTAWEDGLGAITKKALAGNPALKWMVDYNKAAVDGLVAASDYVTSKVNPAISGTAEEMADVSENTETATENVIQLGDKMIQLPKGPEAAAVAIKAVAAEADALATALNDFFGELDKKAESLSQKAQTQKNYLDAQKREMERIAAENAQTPELINIGPGGTPTTEPGAENTPTGTESDPVIVQPSKAAAAPSGGGFMSMSVLPGGSAAGLDITSLMRLLQRLDTLDARRMTGPRYSRNQDVVDAMNTSRSQSDREKIREEINLQLAMQGKGQIASTGNAKLALASLQRSTGSDAAIISQATETNALLRRMIQLQENQLRKIL
jgi:hypothetical protein